ncbi:hypothetical protein, partial [Streptomyces sp. NPDC000188]|uniref:hypothetical protein n=1 Tax=Streptomyces sp. NPDC000188 TaxID=3154245 RepID=UPI0033282543
VRDRPRRVVVAGVLRFRGRACGIGHVSPPLMATTVRRCAPSTMARRGARGPAAQGWTGPNG